MCFCTVNTNAITIKITVFFCVIFYVSDIFLVQICGAVFFLSEIASFFLTCTKCVLRVERIVSAFLMSLVHYIYCAVFGFYHLNTSQCFYSIQRCHIFP